MSDLIIDDSNRDTIQSKYVDYLISRMDFIEIRENLRDCLNLEKILYSHDDLMDEIKSRGTDAIKEISKNY